MCEIKEPVAWGAAAGFDYDQCSDVKFDMRPMQPSHQFVNVRFGGDMSDGRLAEDVVHIEQVQRIAMAA